MFHCSWENLRDEVDLCGLLVLCVCVCVFSLKTIELLECKLDVVTCYFLG